MAVSVLYIQTNGVFGGSARSLLELIQNLNKDEVSSFLMIPKGSAVDLFRSECLDIVKVRGVPQFDNTLYGYYRGARWFILLREVHYLVFFLWALLKNKKNFCKLQLIHVNEITAIVPAVIAKWVTKLPVVMHVRSVQAPQSYTPMRNRIISWILKRYIDQVVAIDETVKNSLPNGVKADVIHNGHTTRAKKEDSNALMQQKEPLSITVGMVGGLLDFKGVKEFLGAAQLCVERNVEVEFILVGDNARNLKGIRARILRAIGFYSDTRAECQDFVSTHMLEEKIKILGFTKDIDEIYRQIDVLCFPSHLNAIGRPVFEAAFFGVPSVVAIKDPFPDTFIDSKTGIAIPAKNPQALADAIEFFYRNPSERKRMGENARKLAEKNFDSKKNAQKVLAIYESVLAKCAS